MSLSLPQIAHRGVPVVLTSTLADAYEVKSKQIRQNFSQNKDRFIEGKHYFTLSGNDLREFKHRVEKIDSVKIARNVNALTLWTERGAARHAKMLNSDKAWDMFELLEETFFRVAEQKNSEEMSIEERRPLTNLVAQWQAKSQASFPDLWRELHAVFGITTVAELPAFQLPAALAWVQAKIDGLSTSVHSDIHSDIHSNVPICVPNAPDFPIELANSGRKGDKVLNLWEELEELRMKLVSCNHMVFFTCTTGRLMFLPPEKLLLHEILRDSVKQAQDSLSQAQRAVQSALRLKHRVDFHNI